MAYGDWDLRNTARRAATEGNRADGPLVAIEPGAHLVRLCTQQDEGVLVGIHQGQPASVGAVRPHRTRRREQALPGLDIAQLQVVNLPHRRTPRR